MVVDLGTTVVPRTRGRLHPDLAARLRTRPAEWRPAALSRRFCLATSPTASCQDYTARCEDHSTTATGKPRPAVTVAGLKRGFNSILMVGVPPPRVGMGLST